MGIERLCLVQLKDPPQRPSQRLYRLQERASLRESYRPLKEDRYSIVDGWWTVDAGRVWALFRTKEAADLWRAGCQNTSSAPRAPAPKRGR